MVTKLKAWLIRGGAGPVWYVGILSNYLAYSVSLIIFQPSVPLGS